MRQKICLYLNNHCRIMINREEIESSAQKFVRRCVGLLRCFVDCSIIAAILRGGQAENWDAFVHMPSACLSLCDLKKMTKIVEWICLGVLNDILAVCLKGDPFCTIGYGRESLCVSWRGGGNVPLLYVVPGMITSLFGSKMEKSHLLHLFFFCENMSLETKCCPFNNVKICIL